MKRILLKAFLFIGFSLFLFALLLNGSLRLSSNDKRYIEYFLKEWKMDKSLGTANQSFENQIAFISRLQDSTLSQFNHEEIAPSNSANMEYYYTQRKGLCFNRSFFQEKILKYAGFKTRHIYIYFTEDSTPTRSRDVFNRRLMSHAMFEVKTKKGWMAVDTNGNWIALDENREPMTLGELRERLMEERLVLAKMPTKGTVFFNQLPIKYNFKFLYGVYSRHGEYLNSGPVEKMIHNSAFLRSTPDYNLREFFYNL